MDTEIGQEMLDWITEHGPAIERSGEPALEGERVENLPVSYEDRLPADKLSLQAFQDEASALRGKVFGMKIANKEGQAEVAELKATAQKIIKRIDARVKELIKEPEIVTAWKEYCLGIKNFAATLEIPLKESKAEADRKYAIFSEYERQERRKADEAARESTRKLQERENKKAEKKGIEPIVFLQPVPIPKSVTVKTDSGTTHERREWKFEVTNPDEVERSLCCPDFIKISERVKGGARDPEIPGVHIYEKVTPITRTN